MLHSTDDVPSASRTPVPFPKVVRALVVLLLIAASWETTEAFLSAHPLQPAGPSLWLSSRPILHLAAAVLALLASANVGAPRGRSLFYAYATVSFSTTLVGLGIQLSTVGKAVAVTGLSDDGASGLKTVLVVISLLALAPPIVGSMLIRRAPEFERHHHATYLLSAVSAVIVAVVAMRLAHPEPALVQVMIDVDDKRRAHAAEMLAGTQEFLVLSALAGMVRDSKEPTLVKAAMGSLAKSGAASLPFLDGMLRADNISERRQGVLISKWLVGEPRVRVALLPATLFALRDTANGDHAAIGEAVVRLAKKADSHILPKILPMLDHQSPQVRSGIYLAVGLIPSGCNEARGALNTGMRDPDDAVALAATRALLQCDDGGIAELSQELASKLEQRRLRVMRALKAPLPSAAHWNEWWTLIGMALQDPTTSVTIAALEVVAAATTAGETRPTSVRERIERLKSDPNPGVADRARRAANAPNNAQENTAPAH